MGARGLMRGAALAAFMIAAAAAAYADTRVNLTGAAVASFAASPTAGDVAATFGRQNPPIYGGFGFEVVTDHIGIGGLYTAYFQRDTTSDWWMDWYGEALYVSFHLFHHRTLIDPFVSLGIGSAGIVELGPSTPRPATSPTLLLSLFPAISGGLALDLHGLYLGGKLTYLPVISPPPATPFENVPLAPFQFTLFAGVSIGRW